MVTDACSALTGSRQRVTGATDAGRTFLAGEQSFPLGQIGAISEQPRKRSAKSNLTTKVAKKRKQNLEARVLMQDLCEATFA